MAGGFDRHRINGISGLDLKHLNDTIDVLWYKLFGNLSFTDLDSAFQKQYLSLQSTTEDNTASLEVLNGKIETKVGTSELGTQITQNADSVRTAVGQIGGNNLIKNSAFRMDMQGWQYDPNYVARDATYQLGGVTSVRLLVPYDGGTKYGSGLTQDFNVLPNTTYMISFWAYTDNNAFSQEGFRIYMPTYDTGWNLLTYNHNLTLSSDNLSNNQWKKFEMKVTTGSTARFGQLKMDFSYGGRVWINSIKVEIGDKSTAWSPHADELKSSVAEITDGHFKFTCSDGSYMEMEPSTTGLHWHKGSTVKDFHYLSAVGFGYSSNGFEDITITLPSEFQGKNFTPIVSLSSIGVGSTYVAVNRANVMIPSALTNIAAGTFVVRVDSLSVNTSSGQTSRVGLTFSWMAIA